MDLASKSRQSKRVRGDFGGFCTVLSANLYRTVVHSFRDASGPKLLSSGPPDIQVPFSCSWNQCSDFGEMIGTVWDIFYFVWNEGMRAFWREEKLDTF